MDIFWYNHTMEYYITMKTVNSCYMTQITLTNNAEQKKPGAYSINPFI